MYKNEKGLNGMLEETRSRFENFDGLILRRAFSQLEDQIASGLYICEDRETAEKVKVIIHEIMEEYDDDIGFSTEFIFK
ncbi:hypothetical protein ACFL0D_08005 [Thermoproteota archaeon]